jgi:hypothetical protein
LVHLTLKSHHCVNSTVAITTLDCLGLQINYHWPWWPICWMICSILFVRLSFPYWLWRRLITYTKFQLRAYGGCDRSAEDAYSSAAYIVLNPTLNKNYLILFYLAPDPTFALVGGPCCLIHSILYLPFGLCLRFTQC